MGDPEILTRVSQYEMAFRVQSSVPDLVDMSKGRASVLRRTERSRRWIVRIELPAGASAG